MKDDNSTPQINVSKIPGGGGVAGAMFAILSTLIFLVGVPALRLFLLGALILGLAGALLIRFARRETPGRPWILPAADQTKPTAAQPGAENPSQDRGTNLQALSPA